MAKPPGANQRFAGHAVGSLCLHVDRIIRDVGRCAAPFINRTRRILVNPACDEGRDRACWKIGVATDYGDWYRAKCDVRIATRTDGAVCRSSNARGTGPLARRLAANESIEAEVRAVSRKRKAERASCPIPRSRVPPEFWSSPTTVHHHQSAPNQWGVQGSRRVQRCATFQGSHPGFKTVFQDGWSALSGCFADSIAQIQNSPFAPTGL